MSDYKISMAAPGKYTIGECNVSDRWGSPLFDLSAGAEIVVLEDSNQDWMGHVKITVADGDNAGKQGYVYDNIYVTPV